MNLRTRTRELLRRLPVEQPAEASNMRLLVAALVSAETERMEWDEDGALFKTGYMEPAPGHDPGVAS